MSTIDWTVLAVTLFGIIFYGILKSRNLNTMEGYLLADRKMPWYHVGLSVMATQASAITFLSAPGQGYTDGLRFVQFYFGLPLAMIVLCVTFIPIFQRLNVFTAYEYLEKRFDNKTRTLTAFLFLLQRGISTGITIYAPAIVLSTILSIDITYTTFIMGGLVILYTVYGGAKAVSYTQMIQMGVIFTGLFMAAYMVVHLLPAHVGFSDALHIAGKMGKLNAINTDFKWDDRYNIWSGIIGGFFLQLSYFGTDQSQVGRYLTGKSIAQSRLGLVMNGLLKIPMQFLILLIGTMVFAFYQYHQPPINFNRVAVEEIKNSPFSANFDTLEYNYAINHSKKLVAVNELVLAEQQSDVKQVNVLRKKVNQLQSESDTIRSKGAQLMLKNNKKADVNDTNYVFLRFVMDFLPTGLVGLLIAIIFLASMGSTASGLNSLASTTVVDFYQRFKKTEKSQSSLVLTSRWITVMWGTFCLFVALFAARLGNLIEVVNILGSLFYGTILGIFVVAFYCKRVGGKAVFIAAIIAELFVVVSWYLDLTAFLWLNLLGCALVVVIALILEFLLKEPHNETILD